MLGPCHVGDRQARAAVCWLVCVLSLQQVVVRTLGATGFLCVHPQSDADGCDQCLCGVRVGCGGSWFVSSGAFVCRLHSTNQVECHCRSDMAAQ